MTGFGIEFLGCKISQTDAESVREALEEAGHVQDARGPIQVLNTCCITAEAEKKSRKRVRQLLARGDDVRVFVTGCGAQLHPDSYASPDGRVTVLAGASGLARHAIVEAADQLAGLGCRQDGSGQSGAVGRTRAFVKVQDGCNFNCSYCIVPTVRGEPRSRTWTAIERDVARRVARGQTEIVLTGVNIGLFREPDERFGLAQLLPRIAEIPGVRRLRISSIESNHVNRRLVEAMAATPLVGTHLHIPMQSGDDEVLAAMGRHYNRDGFARAVSHARDMIGDALTVTTDVIIGFPGETDGAFENTRALCTELGITKVHAFPYSARPGTPAADLHVATAVPVAVVRERSRVLRAEADERAARRRMNLLGTTVEVLAESGRGHGVTLTTDPAEDCSTDERTFGHARRGYTADYTPVQLLHPARNGEMVRGTVIGSAAGRLLVI